MVTNYEEAVLQTAEKFGFTPEYIKENDIVVEYDAEDDLTEFTAWLDKNGNRIKKGIPIGYSVVIDGKESPVFVYYGSTELNVDESFFKKCG